MAQYVAKKNVKELSILVPVRGVMKILVKAIAGSHLFGTNTPQSDLDYKGVFLPSSNEIILGNYSDTIRHSTGNDGAKNTKDDVDTELYSLRKFLVMIENGDTAALELLFTPAEFVIEKHPIWDEIVAIRHTLISKKINSMIGYARQQANKYGIKGSRMGELNNVLKALKDIEKRFDFKGAKLKHGWDDIVLAVKDFQHVHIIEMHPTKDSVAQGLDILGKRFSDSTPFEVLLKNLSDEYKKYGQRAREARDNNGIDFKALSHAVRVMIQGIELMQSEQITIPHLGNNLKLISDIKQGKMEYKKVEPIIEELLTILERKALESELPDRLDRTYLDNLLLHYYKQEINE